MHQPPAILAVMRKSTSGFTIVELLIVIVVIGILAAITIVAFNGVQQSANDTRGLQDIASIRKALEQYKVLNGQYPAATNLDTNHASWQASVNTDTWLTSLNSVARSLPVDPINDATHLYTYYRSAAGTQGCDPSAGPFYVLVINRLQSRSGLEVSDNARATSICTSISASRTATATRAVFWGFEN